MILTLQNNVDAGNDFTLKPNDNDSVPVELQDHAEELHQTVTKVHFSFFFYFLCNSFTLPF